MNEPRLRGSFMSINGALQQVASGVGSMIGGALIVQQATGGKFQGYGTVGWISCGVMIVSVWLGSGLTKNAG
jgi:hypothetical protein